MLKTTTLSEEKAKALQDKGIDVALLEPVLLEYAPQKGTLITILQKAQAIYGYLDEELLEYISGRTGEKTAKILGVATFYTQFRLSPLGKYIISVCHGTACHVNGAESIQDAIEDELGITDGETTSDGLFSLQRVACLGCCSLAPVMVVNGETYSNLTPEKARKALRDIRARDAEEVSA